jgi:hypothetical protein
VQRVKRAGRRLGDGSVRAGHRPDASVVSAAACSLSERQHVRASGLVVIKLYTYVPACADCGLVLILHSLLQKSSVML